MPDSFATSRSPVLFAARDRVVTVLGGAFDRVAYRGLRHVFHRSRAVVPASAEELDRNFLMLETYAALTPDRAFPSRPVAATVVSRRRIRGGSRTHRVFETPYRPHHRAYAGEFAGYDRVRRVHLFGWEHPRPAPATLLLVHGWGAGSPAVHYHEFGIDHFFRRLGMDVYFYVLPFHGLRKPGVARFSGELHPSPNLMRTNEAFLQTGQELRSIISLIKERNEAPLGMMGSSLGGYTTALLSSVDDRLDFAVPVLPPASLADLFWEQGAREQMRARVEAAGMTRERFNRAWRVHSPLSYTPRVPAQRRLIVTATGDGLVTPPHVDALWEHWDRPERISFPGGHILQLGRARYHRDVGRFLRRARILPDRS